MSDDRRTQPIEMRMQPEPSFRDLLMGMTGELGAMRVSLRHLEEGARQRDDKLDILNDRLEEMNATIQRGIGAGQIQDRDLTELQSTVYGNSARNERGLTNRVDDLEDFQAKQRYTLKGAMMTASAVGAAISAAVTAAGFYFGRGR